MSYAHYIPQVYQQGFLDPTSVGIVQREPFLWLYSKLDRSIRAKAPHNILGKKNLYALYDSEGNVAEDIEKYLAIKLEGPFATFKKRLLPLIERFDIKQLRQQFTFNDRLLLIYFLLWQAKRGQGYIEHIKRGFLAEVGKDNPGEDLTAYAQSPEFQNNVMWILDNVGAEWEGKKAWEILANRDIVFSVIGWHNANFVSSDNPVLMINPAAPSGILNPTTQLAMPLTSKVTVTMTGNGGQVHLDTPANRSVIRAFNTSLCDQAYEFVFSPDKPLLERLTKSDGAARVPEQA